MNMYQGYEGVFIQRLLKRIGLLKFVQETSSKETSSKETSSKEKKNKCQNNAQVMEKHGLGTHNGKMCPENLTGKPPNIPQFIRPISQNRPIKVNLGLKDSGLLG